MSTYSDTAISEVLKLYDMVNVHQIFNKVQQTNGFEPDNAEMESSSSNSQMKEILQPLKLLDNAKNSCIECFLQLHSHLSVLLEGTGFKMGFERAFATLFGQDAETFTVTMILNLDQLQQQLDQEESSKVGSIAALCVLNKQLQVFIDSKFTMEYDYDSEMTKRCFADHTGIEVDTFRDTLIQLMGDIKAFIEKRAQHRFLDDNNVKGSLVQSCDVIGDSGNASDVGSVVTICNETETDKLDPTSSSVTLIAHDMDADPRPIKENVLCAEVPLTEYNNVISNEQQHTDQVMPTYDTYLLEKTDSNIISDSTNMNHKGGENDQDAECDDLLSSVLMTEAFKSNDMVDRETFNELSKKFLQLEKHCISLEIAMQQKEESFQNNQPCKNPELPDFREYFMINDLKDQVEKKNLTINNLKKRISEMCDTCNEVKAKHECAVVELKHNVAELLKENESLKNHCKNLNESIKETKIKNTEQTNSLIAKNDEFKAQLQEKGFTITALKNELRKATGNSVNTKFAKPSILGKPVSQSNRNQSTVRQPTAFRSERTKFPKTRFASQVDAEQVLTKPVTPHYFPNMVASSSVNPQRVATPTTSSHRSSLRTESKQNIKIRNSYDINDLYKNSELEKARKRALLHKDGILGSQPCRMPPSLLRNNAKVQPAKSRIHSKPSTMHKKQNKPKSSPRWIPNAKSLQTRNNDKLSTMHTKLSSPRPCHKWVPTGRIFKHIGLKWIPTRKVLTDGNAMVDRETPKGLDTSVTNPYICCQVCDVSAGTPNSVAGTSNIHHIRRRKVWKPKATISPTSGGLESQC